jgi:hypothetical protein
MKKATPRGAMITPCGPRLGEFGRFAQLMAQRNPLNLPHRR